MQIDALIREAIAQYRLLAFDYNGRPRVVEPHLYGAVGGVLQLQAFQVGGSSSSGSLPEWRLFRVEKMLRAELLESHFAGPRQDSARSRRFDQVLANVIKTT